MNLFASRMNAPRNRSLMTSAFFSRVFNLIMSRLFHVSALYSARYRKPSVTESRQVCIELSAFLEKRVYVILVQHASRPSPTPSADVIEEQFLKACRFHRFWSNDRFTSSEHQGHWTRTCGALGWGHCWALKNPALFFLVLNRYLRQFLLSKAKSLAILLMIGELDCRFGYFREIENLQM